MPTEKSLENFIAERSNANRRRFRRRYVSIPCTVTWEREAIIATICNISFDGALIRAKGAPSEGAGVAVRFTFGDQGVQLQGVVTSEVIHAEGEGEEQTFGVKFDTSMVKYWREITPAMRAMLKETGGDDQDLIA